MFRGFNWFTGLIGSRVQLVQGFNWFKGSIISICLRVQLDVGSIWFESFNGSIGSKVQIVQGSMVQFLQEFNWFNVAIAWFNRFN